MSQAREVCKRMTRILSREGAEPRVSGFFFKAVVQAMLLFGLETWVVIPRTGWALGEFQYQVARRLMGGGDPTAETWWELEVHLDGGGKGGGGVLDDGGINSAMTENGRTVYCYAVTDRPV